MKEQFISFETAKQAKAKGFPQTNARKGKYREDGRMENLGTGAAVCDINNEWFEAPRQSLLQKWLREDKGIAVDVYTNLKDRNTFKYGCDMIAFFDLSDEWRTYNFNKFFDTYEQALENGLYKALEFIKD